VAQAWQGDVAILRGADSGLIGGVPSILLVGADCEREASARPKGAPFHLDLNRSVHHP
jgi:hypothetical protein